MSECLLCNKTTTELIFHLKMFHGISIDTRPSPAGYECAGCGFRTFSRFDFNQHLTLECLAMARLIEGKGR